MAQLVLQVVSLDAAPPTQALARTFDDGGGTIGRDESNTFPLPDKHRRVSRLHATLSFPGGIATITNSSTSLPISVGEQQLEAGESAPVANGAMIEIGPYVLQARIEAGAAVQKGMAAPAMPVARAHAPDSFANPAAAPLPAASVPLNAAPRATEERLPVQQAFAAAPPQRQPAHPMGADMSPVFPAPASPMPAAAVRPMVPPSSLAPSVPPAAMPPAAPVPAAIPATFDAAIPAAIDPFADLLHGIGGSPVPATPAAFPAFAASPAPMQPLISQPTNGLSLDPLAALGASPGSSPAYPQTADWQPSPGRPAISAPGTTDDFNPFAMPSEVARNTADPLAALLGVAAPGGASTAPEGSLPAPSIDSLFQSAPGTGSSSLLGFGTSASPAAGGDIASLLQADANSDPFALFGTPSSHPSGLPAMRDNSPEVGSAFYPPAAMPNVPTPATLSPAGETIGANLFAPAAAAIPAPMVATEASANSLTDAFLRGAGLAPSALPQGLTPEIMTIVGSLLRSATAGAVDMLAARAATKREVQASVTIISVQANNPLKFLPNADAALLQLLGKKMPGFMRADIAMKDAFDDLRAHEVGVIAGTRAALTEVLGKFDPGVLGEKLAKGSVLESLMPSARKAKLWDMYLERYTQIRREAEDDFQSIFGRAFVQAYERETARIKGESP